MSSMSLQNLKTASMIRDTEEKRRDNREKAMLLFTFQLLLDKGYVDTASSLASECSLNLELYSICENIDLHSIFLEFEAYYNLRFQRFPQYFKKSMSPSGSSENLLGKLRGFNNNNGNRKSSSSSCSPATPAGNKTPKVKNLEGESINSSESHFSVQGFQPNSNNNNNNNKVNTGEVETGKFSRPEGFYAGGMGEKLLKPISGLDFASEDARMFAEMIQREIVVSNLSTTWKDIVGLEDARTILQEALVQTREFQDFFGSAVSPWKGLLLYGPPGTGKTLLAKAVASECGTTFFNISSATLISKWRGDSEKIVKVLFQLARYHAPSTIFFDEFDALGSKRDSGDSDAGRRLKSELLQQMDGVLAECCNNNFSDRNNGCEHKPVFILAATNLPWDLDPAILRRLEKRIYVPLPNSTERRAILHLNLTRTAERVAENSRRGRNTLAYQIDLDALAVASNGYSGSDLQQIVKEVIIRKFREDFDSKNKKLVVVTDDLLRVLKSIPPTVKSNLNEKFTAWQSSTEN